MGFMLNTCLPLLVVFVMTLVGLELAKSCAPIRAPSCQPAQLRP